MTDRKTLNVESDVRHALLQLSWELSSETGRRYTMSDTIRHLLDRGKS